MCTVGQAGEISLRACTDNMRCLRLHPEALDAGFTEVASGKTEPRPRAPLTCQVLPLSVGTTWQQRVSKQFNLVPSLCACGVSLCYIEHKPSFSSFPLPRFRGDRRELRTRDTWASECWASSNQAFSGRPSAR